MSTYDTPESARYDTASRVEVVQRRSARDVGAQIFLWLAWALAFGFWAMTMSSFFGIMRTIGSGGGVLLIALVGGVALLAAAIWGAARRSSRDGRRDPATEASTAALYNGAQRPSERESYRPA